MAAFGSGLTWASAAIRWSLPDLLPPEITVHDPPLVQRLDARLDLTLVAHHHDVEVIRVDVLPRDALHVGGRDGGDAVHVVVVVVERQAEREELAEARRGGARRLEVPGQAQRGRGLRL